MSKPAPKSFYLRTFGCQMNVYDSERMVEALARDGYGETQAIDEADLVILNTCHIREKAAEKVYSDLGRIRQIKAERASEGKGTVVAVTGCVAQAEGTEIPRRQPAVDLVIGPQSYHRLPEFIRAAQAGRKIVETEFPGDEKFEGLTAPRRVASPSAFLTVQEGCDKFCTFCVVPYTRGAEYSRPVGDLVKEARALVAGGASEVFLLGQNVNAYHGAGSDGESRSLTGLIEALAGVEGLKRIRYTTSHPRDMTEELIAAHRDIPQLMPYLHLPVQSGSDRVLAAMNRKHTAREYIDVIRRVRDARPEIALSSDFIVGFPGEDDADFEATMNLVREVGFAQAYSFKYSPRPGTPAATREQVAEPVKAERLQRLQALLEEQQSAFNNQSVGQTVPVLFERQSREEGVLTGRTPCFQIVHAKVESGVPSGTQSRLIGHIRQVSITGSRQMSLSGTIAEA